MEADDFDRQMRRFESLNDDRVLPGIYMVARIDGRNFTRLTKDVHPFDAPFDERFRDLMLDAMARVMDCGFRVTYGFAQSDEISILLHRDESLFERKERKLVSVLASEATSAFVLGLGVHAAFDCRISQLPNEEYLLDYFRWRQHDAARNALNAHAYWLLRNGGATAREAAEALNRTSASEKHDLLYSHGTNFNDLPAWQKRGTGMWWETYERPPSGDHPRSKPAIRRRLQTELELPLGEAYDRLLAQRIQEATGP